MARIQRCLTGMLVVFVLAWTAAVAHAQPASPAAKPPPMRVQQAAPGIFYVQGLSALGSAANQNFISNAAFVVTSEGVVVIDALGSPELARRLLAEIRQRTRAPIHTVVVTHYHADHIYGLQVFQAEGARVLAHQAAKEYLYSETAQQRLQASRQDLWPWVDEKTRLIEPTEWLQGATHFELGGVRFEVIPVGPSHTAEDLVIYLPQKKVLFAGDLVFRNRIPYVGQADSRHWIEALQHLLEFDATVIIPGHGPISTEPQSDMRLTRDYLVYLRESMAKAAEELTPFDEAYRQTDWRRFENVPLFKVANRMNAYNTYLLLEREAPK